MTCPLCGDAIVPGVVHGRTQRLQALVGSSEVAGEAVDLREVFEGIAVPSTVLGDLVVRGLVCEWLTRAGLRYQIRKTTGPGAHYELVLPEALSRSERDRKTGTAIVERARKFMNERYGESLTNEMIAQLVGCSPSYLARTFRSAFGLNPGKHLRDICVGAGLEPLRTTVLSIENVSQKVGSRGKSSFYAAVRSTTGETPGATRMAQWGSGSRRPTDEADSGLRAVSSAKTR